MRETAMISIHGCSISSPLRGTYVPTTPTFGSRPTVGIDEQPADRWRAEAKRAAVFGDGLRHAFEEVLRRYEKCRVYSNAPVPGLVEIAVHGVHRIGEFCIGAPDQIW